MAESLSMVQDEFATFSPPSKPSSSSRRLPPPCWSHDETVALIDSYRDKWYSLRRGNLRANHWQEVADAVAARSAGSPPKTAVQCRHKMEKLRKRYRTEVQRAASVPNGHRFASSWVHFKRMDSMEKGTSLAAAVESSHDADDDENDDPDEEEDLYQSVKRGGSSYDRGAGAPMSNGIGSGAGSGFRIRIPGRWGGVPPHGTKTYNGKFYPDVSPNPSPNILTTRVVRDGFSVKRDASGRSGRGGKKREGSPVGEMACAIKALGDGFMRMERMKMDMAREIESMRMEMELKRTEMILESQHQIVEAFAKAFSERESKKLKRMPTPES
ncbi:trihelix transcription factor ASIL1-like [Diospyros lotus]|uniref:trihelix transcription factor ASIL1-like n=1 Tax=Diospyros lotus TaxID=55363 RepID=UPI0022587CF9|nr:trihelix transcription factor ASIL1-like [Diospyros lotus]